VSRSAEPAERFEILLLVGTDHHAFRRAVTWADDRQRAHPHERVFIQYGKSAAPGHAAGEAFLGPDQLRAAIARADVVITHGGPGTISDARHGGHRPIVFPRDPQYGEHVDDHQQRFAAWCDARGLARFARTVSDLDAAVGALSPMGTRGAGGADPATAAAVATVGALIDGTNEAVRVRPGSPVVVHLSAGSEQELSSAEAVLATMSGITMLGDVTSLLAPGATESHPCDCGVTALGCEFWDQVGTKAFGGWDAARAEGVLAVAQRLPGSPWSLARRYQGRSTREEILAYAGPYRALFAAAQEISGADVLVVWGGLGPALAWSHDRQLDVRSLRLSPMRSGWLTRLRGLTAAEVHGPLPGGLTRALHRLVGDAVGTIGSADHGEPTPSHTLRPSSG
jgi:UDP-N-acetylglucosamine transferase subunit ALG13